MQTYQKIPTLYAFDNEKKMFIRGNFTDPIVGYLQNCPWLCTEKIDGENTRVLWDGYSFTLSGRTDNYIPQKETYAEFKRVFNKEMEVMVEQIFGDKTVIFCMETYGGKICGGAYSGSERFIGFDIICNDYYMDRLVAFNIFKKLGIETVPYIVLNDIQEVENFVLQHLESYVDPGHKMEGLVCTPTVRLYNHKNERIIFKVKFRDFRKTYNMPWNKVNMAEFDKFYKK